MYPGFGMGDELICQDLMHARSHYNPNSSHPRFILKEGPGHKLDDEFTVSYLRPHTRSYRPKDQSRSIQVQVRMMDLLTTTSKTYTFLIDPEINQEIWLLFPTTYMIYVDRTNKSPLKLHEIAVLWYHILCILSWWTLSVAWWRHQMESFYALLTLCADNSPVTGEFPSQRPATRSFDVFFDLHLSKRLSKQPRAWWFETPSRPCEDVNMHCVKLIPTNDIYVHVRILFHCDMVDD